MQWIGRNIHTSWLVAVVATSFVIGVWSCLFVVLPSWLWLIAPALVLVCLLFRFLWLLPILVGAGLCVGNIYGAGEQQAQSKVAPLYGQTITVSGVIREDITRDAKDGVKMQLHLLHIANNHVAGSLFVVGTTKSQLLRGDRVTVIGQFREGFGTFIGTMYRVQFQQIERANPGDTGRVVRDGFAEKVRLGIQEPQASLGIGYLTGQKSSLPENLNEALQIAGLTHIVVASGYNLTILVRLARRLFIRWSKFLSAISAAAMILSFVAVTGLSPSMTRAGIVSGFSLLAWYYGRAFHPLVLLPFVAAITVLWQPSYAWGDLGWQLSFAAFAGVMIVAPLLQRYFFGKEPPGILRQVLGETVAAHLVTLPITVPAFGTLSHVAIIANLMIVPLVPLAMLLTFIVGCSAFILPTFVVYVGLPAQWLLIYMTTAATWLSELPWATLELQPPWWAVLLYVLAFISACVYMQRVTGFHLREVSPIE